MELAHPEKGNFKVNGQRLKPYFSGEVDKCKEITILKALGEINWKCDQLFHHCPNMCNIECQGSQVSNVKLSASLKATQVCEDPFFFSLLSMFFQIILFLFFFYPSCV